jgi:hypothetical protein
MDSIRIAEWILELLMTRERAEAVAGDLREAGRGAFWFWRDVFTTMIASIWGDFRSDWWKMVFAILAINAIWVVGELRIIAPILPQSVSLYMRLNLALNSVQGFAVPFLIALCFPRRELATVLAGLFVGPVVSVAFLWWMWPNGHYNFSPGSAVLALAGPICARFLRLSTKRRESPGETHA